MEKYMKNKILFFFTMICMPVYVKPQCTEAKDPDMAKYKRLTETQDAQGCSQCAMLSLYFCSAKYCVKPEDVRKVDAMITACKSNIKNMGQPYCCPELVGKQPEWGIGVNGSSTGGTNSVNSAGSFGGGGNTTTATGIVVGNSSNTNGYSQSYTGGSTGTDNDDLVDVLNTTAGVLDILSGGSGAVNFESGDESDIINTTSEIIQGIVNSGNSGAGVGTSSYGNYTSGNSTLDATNYINQVISDVGGSGTFTTGDISGAMDIVNGVGSILNLIDEADAEAERKRQAELQRQRQLEEIRQREERARQERLRIINSRKAVVSSIPQAKIPLTYPGISNNEIYFFAYFTTNTSLESNNPEISITNVFTVNRYSDGSWPLLSKLTDRVTYATKISGIQIAGYYTNRLDAETSRSNLVTQAKVASIRTIGIQYSEQAITTNTNSGSSDFWETNHNKKQNSSDSNTNTSTKDNNTKPILDFWDNPINQ
jgi:hypothetical protein